MNFAGSWKLPVIFLCQNNQYGEYTKLADYTASKDFASRAAGYGFKGVKLDGNDPVAFYKGMKEVIDELRAGKGPIFVEATTSSEYHTSELHSLLRISYAFFSLYNT